MTKCADCTGGSLCGRQAILLCALLVTVLTALAASAQTFTVLHTFTSGGDGANPSSALIIDRGGNFYGTTIYGGCYSRCYAGTVFRFKPAGAGWILSTLYNLQGGRDGQGPQAPVTIGPDGTLFGTAGGGGYCDPNECGVVFRLQPGLNICHSISCPWTETLLHVFDRDEGNEPGFGAVVFDQAGNLFGTTVIEPDVYELSPSEGGWIHTSIYRFTSGVDGDDPAGGLVLDAAGNLYGTAGGGGFPNCTLHGRGGCGTVFELSPSSNGWTFHSLYVFHGVSDGMAPEGDWFLTVRAICTARLRMAALTAAGQCLN